MPDYIPIPLSCTVVENKKNDVVKVTIQCHLKICSHAFSHDIF